MSSTPRIAVGIATCDAVTAVSVGPAAAADLFYKGNLETQDKRVKIRLNDDLRGDFTLKCAGVFREPFRVGEDSGRYRVTFREEPHGPALVKAEGRFKNINRTKGEVTRIDTAGANCDPDDYEARLRRS